MASSARYEYHDLKPAVGSFLDDVIAGLSARPKTLPPKYFYDARGSRLFNAICELPEYYPTRTELAMLEDAGPEMATRVGPHAEIVEYGSGSGRKTALLIEAVDPRAYIAIDISGEQLREAMTTLAARFPRVRMIALCADYSRPLDLSRLEKVATERRVIFFPGSTIGNLTTDEALSFLRNAREVAGTRGAMLVGVDLKKDRAILEAAYNDSQGVTAQFNLNVLHRINRELGGDFDVDSFEHRAIYNGEAGRIEMHLVSLRAQVVTVGGARFTFDSGESIHTENSYKYSIEEFQALARRAGFDSKRCWVDPDRLFSIHYLAVSR